MERGRTRVSVEIGGSDVTCGYIAQSLKDGRETLSYTYDQEYLRDPSAFALCPGLPLTPGGFYSEGAADLGAFGDTMPDRWGRALMAREERARAKSEGRAARRLFDFDYLCGTSDEQRQGAIRLWGPDGKPLAGAGEGVPRVIDLPRLLDAADKASKDLDADVTELFAAGSSLGGARPKASVRDGKGRLWIAKFPKSEETSRDDVCAWEEVALRLMEGVGVPKPRTELVRVGGRSVLLTERFDREGGRRIPYISGLSAVEGRDGDHSLTYLDLAEFIEAEGADVDKSLRSLWCHALVSAAIGNVDNHMRNFGFLRAKDGWALSPVFDVNPTRPEQRGPFATTLDGSGELPVRDVLDARDLFRVGEAEASKACGKLLGALRGWRAAARKAGISPSSIGSYEGCFAQGIAAVAEQAREKCACANEPIDKQLAARATGEGRPAGKPPETGARDSAKRPAAAEQEVDDG